MIPAPAQYSEDQVFHAFLQDGGYLFLGSAFITVGIVCVGYCVLRRRFEPLLLWLAAFAAPYGIRLWLQSHLMGLEFARSTALIRARSSRESHGLVR